MWCVMVVVVVLVLGGETRVTIGKPRKGVIQREKYACIHQETEEFPKFPTLVAMVTSYRSAPIFLIFS